MITLALPLQRRWPGVRNRRHGQRGCSRALSSTTPFVTVALSRPQVHGLLCALRRGWRCAAECGRPVAKRPEAVTVAPHSVHRSRPKAPPPPPPPPPLATVAPPRPRFDGALHGLSTCCRVGVPAVWRGLTNASRTNAHWDE